MASIGFSDIKFLVGSHVIHYLSKKEGFVTSIHISQEVTYTVSFEDKSFTTHYDYELCKK